MYVSVKMFHQLSVRDAGVRLQDHEILAEGLKMFLRSSRSSDKSIVFAIRSNGNTE